MCVSACLYVSVCLCMHVTERGQRKALDQLEPELQVVLSCSVRVLGSELKSSAKDQGPSHLKPLHFKIYIRLFIYSSIYLLPALVCFCPQSFQSPARRKLLQVGRVHRNLVSFSGGEKQPAFSDMLFIETSLIYWG